MITFKCVNVNNVLTGLQFDYDRNSCNIHATIIMMWHTIYKMVTKKENTTISLVKELLSVSCTLFLISLDDFVISINK